MSDATLQVYSKPLPGVSYETNARPMPVQIMAPLAKAKALFHDLVSINAIKFQEAGEMRTILNPWLPQLRWRRPRRELSQLG